MSVVACYQQWSSYNVLKGRVMKFASILALLIAIPSFADSSVNAKRDSALEAINSCVKRNEVASRECRKLNENIATLVDIYNRGDKSVLPTLFRFTYLTDFYGSALLHDPNYFLSALNKLPEKDQRAVAAGMAGPSVGLRSQQSFEAIRTVLSGVPDAAPYKGTSQICLKTLERMNAAFFSTYFPPRTFVSAAADFQVRWYSSEMYALGEESLWPLAGHGAESTYRLTYIPGFSGPTSITLSLAPDGEGIVAIKTLDADREITRTNETVRASRDQLDRFVSLLDQAHYWTTPTELERTGLDGAEWILEAVRNSRYRVVVRWCPDIERKSREEIPFAEACRLLFEIAGYKRTGC